MTRVCIGEGHTNKQESKMSILEATRIVAEIRRNLQIRLAGSETMAEYNHLSELAERQIQAIYERAIEKK